MKEKTRLVLYIAIVTVMSLLTYFAIDFFQNSGDLVVDNYTVELSPDGTLIETYEYNVGTSGVYTMLYRYWDAPVTYQSSLEIPHFKVTNITSPCISYVKNYHGKVKLIDSSVNDYEIYSKSFNNEIGCYNPHYFNKGMYELKIEYKISPPVQYDGKYYHMNIKLADDHIPYKNVRIIINDPTNDLVKLYTHPPMDIQKNKDKYIITGSSPSDNLIEFEIVSKNIGYGVQSNTENILEKTINANNNYNTAYSILTVIYYLYFLLSLCFGAIILIIYYFKGREKDFVVPEYLNFVPNKRKPWLVNLLFNKTAVKINEHAYHATLLDLHYRKIITIRKENDQIKIQINRTDEKLDGYEAKVFNFLSKWSTNNEFNTEEIQNKIYSKTYDYSQASSLQKDLLILNKSYKNKISKDFITNGRKIPLFIGFFGMILFIIISILQSSYVSTFPILLTIFFFSLIFSFQGFILATAPPSLLGHWKEDYYKEKLEWDAFRRFLSDMAQLKKYNIQDIDIWKEWLIYATALGIGKEVSKSMESLNININEVRFVPVMYGSFYGIHTAVRSTYRSSSGGSGGSFGGGGGFGGGGAGGR